MGQKNENSSGITCEMWLGHNNDFLKLYSSFTLIRHIFNRKLLGENAYETHIYTTLLPNS